MDNSNGIQKVEEEDKKKVNHLEKLTIKQIRFLQGYIQTGNISQSWMKVYKNKNAISAYNSAHKFLQRNPQARQAFLELHGIDDMAIVKALKDGLNATKTQIYKSREYTYNDPYARLKAAEIADKMLHPESSSNKSVGNQINVQINTDAGSFKVVEG